MEAPRVRNGRFEAPMQDRPLGSASMALPQPGWRLLGVASIGLGTGLYTADVPFLALALAFVPALIAMTVIAVEASMSPEIAEAIDRADSGQARHDLR